jgi:hypothetical protein
MQESYQETQQDGSVVMVQVIPEKEPDFTWEYSHEMDTMQGRTQFWTIWPDVQ